MLPTPGVVFRHLKKKMNCCTCAPLAVSTIYDAMDRLKSDTRVCPYALATAREKLGKAEQRRVRRQQLKAADFQGRKSASKNQHAHIV